MSTVIKNGTIVTHDLTYKSDILIDGSTIVEIGPSLKGNNELDASDCYIMPGGIDPHTHLEMPFMGTYSSDDFESGTRAALAGGTTMVVDFALPSYLAHNDSTGLHPPALSIPTRPMRTPSSPWCAATSQCLYRHCL